ncbi:MAG: Bax inhibitor-1/YccA family protein [Ktedonobacterales bacterium]|nr:Bax inhibitor-1/YccA family protein [Ktedonobacterales bacterium]
MSYDYYSDARAVPYSTGLDMRAIMRQVYLWLTLGLAVGFGVSFALGQVASNAIATGEATASSLILFNPIVSIIALVAYLALGFTFYPVVRRVSPAVGAVLYLLFAAVFGFLISTIWLQYKSGTIVSAFVTTAAMFGIMSIVGYTTKLDLSKLGSILFMALLGIIIASVVNLFLRSPAIYWLVTYASVVIFSGLIAYDTQWISKNAASIARTGDSQAAARIALVGAFRLFLDFINLFLSLLRIFGGLNGRN